MQAFKDLIAGFGNILGIDGFEPDAEGVCILESEEAEIRIIDCADAAGEVLLAAALMPLPAHPGPAAEAAQAVSYGPESAVDVDGAAISLRRSDDGEYLFASAELIDLPAKAARQIVLRDMLAANHMFDGTAGATFSLDPKTERVCLQQVFWAHEGGGDDDVVARRVAVFADKVREWKERLEEEDAEPVPEPGSIDLDPSFMKV